jgi:hypothetical protein
MSCDHQGEIATTRLNAATLHRTMYSHSSILESSLHCSLGPYVNLLSGRGARRLRPAVLTTRGLMQPIPIGAAACGPFTP